MSLWTHRPAEVLAWIVEVAALPAPVDPWPTAEIPLSWSDGPVEDFTRTQLLPVVVLSRR